MRSDYSALMEGARALGIPASDVRSATGCPERIDQIIKTAKRLFRVIALENHPDRLPAGISSSEEARKTSIFVAASEAMEVMGLWREDPERFHPDFDGIDDLWESAPRYPWPPWAQAPQAPPAPSPERPRLVLPLGARFRVLSLRFPTESVDRDLCAAVCWDGMNRLAFVVDFSPPLPARQDYSSVSARLEGIGEMSGHVLSISGVSTTQSWDRALRLCSISFRPGDRP